MYNNVLLKQIDLFISFLRKLDYQDLYDLEEGLMKITFVKQKSSKEESYSNSEIYDFYVKEISRLSSRDNGFEYLNKLNLPKKDLEGILKYLGVVYCKKDNKSKLQSKIIENTVGKKLRDAAIINK